MKVKQLKEKVLDANLELVRRGLVLYTWGNVSQIDREKELVAIKPSGVDYDKLQADDIVVLTLDGEQVEGDLRPSSDTPTHLVLYRAFEAVGGIVHTHSTWATSWAQAGLSIPCYGTTHADYFYGEVPCARDLTTEEIDGEYEVQTGNVIVKTFEHTDPVAVPGVLVAHHGPFSWGKNGADAVYHAAVLEQVAWMAANTRRINEDAIAAPQDLQDKHYNRKHGKNAYYGQEK